MLEPSADIMKFVGRETKDGHGNFKFTASAACPPLIPYAPACYHASKQPCFAIGLENSKLVPHTASNSLNGYVSFTKLGTSQRNFSCMKDVFYFTVRTWKNATSRLKNALEERCKVMPKY